MALKLFAGFLSGFAYEKEKKTFPRLKKVFFLIEKKKIKKMYYDNVLVCFVSNAFSGWALCLKLMNVSSRAFLSVLRD